MSETINDGFWDLDADDRAAAMLRASDDGPGFWDLDAEDRAAVYDRATEVDDMGGWDPWI